MAERIYMRDDEGGLESLEEERFSTEDDLHSLIAEHPDLLDGEQIRPGDRRRWLVVSREKGIAETAGSGDRWALDLLIVDQDATPTLVEVKRGASSEIRRTIVGQLLEYAAHAVQTWTADGLRSAFEESAKDRDLDPGEELRELLEPDGEAEADGFWERVAAKLAARRMRLLFVADEIPDPLERVVDFLNAHMPTIEVMAVEIKKFQGKQTQALVPRVIGRPATAAAQGSTSRRRRLNRETFLDQFTGDEARSTAARLLDAAQEAGAEFGWGSTCVSLRARCPRWKWPITVAWLYPPSTESSGYRGSKNVTLGVAVLEYNPPPDEELRDVLVAWANSFRDGAFTTEDASRKDMSARSVKYDAAAACIDELTRRLTGILQELAAMEPSPEAAQ